MRLNSRMRAGSATALSVAANWSASATDSSLWEMGGQHGRTVSSATRLVNHVDPGWSIGPRGPTGALASTHDHENRHGASVRHRLRPLQSVLQGQARLRRAD